MEEEIVQKEAIGENKIRKKDAAKEVLILQKKLRVVSIALIVAPLLTLFMKNSSNYLFAFFPVISAFVGGFFLKQTTAQIKYLQNRYDLK